MKVLKLKHKHYANLPQLMRDAGVVCEQNRADPGRVHVHKKDLAKMRSEISKALKKQYPYIPANKLKFSVAMEMLNLSPAECNAVQPGYAIVEDENVNAKSV